MIPVYLFIISTVFLLLYGIFQLVTGSLSYQATSPIGHAVPSLSIVSHSKSFYQRICLFDRGWSYFKCRSLFQGSKRKECRSNLDHYVTDFRFSFCWYHLPKLLDGDYASTRRNYSFTDGSRHPWSFLLRPPWILYLPILHSLNFGRSCKYWLFGLPYAGLQYG